MIEIRNLVKEYHNKKRTVIGVHDVSLTIRQGEIYGIVGYSGAGKSTLLRCMNLLERPTSGEVIVNGVNLTALRDKELRKARLKIGMIFQHFHLVSSKTVYENVAFALKAAKKPANEIAKRVDELLEMVGLSDKRDMYPSQLSGGQKQRVGIARALANDPSVLLCDEATSALDPSTTKQILSLLKKINLELGITIVLITHEMDVVKDICHRIAVMQDGQVVEENNVYDIFTNPQQPVTKSFIDSVLQFDLPEHLWASNKGTIVKVELSGEQAKNSLITEILQTFRIKGKILHGKMEYIQDMPLGIFILELDGDRSEIERAIHYITKQSKRLEVVKHAA